MESDTNNQHQFDPARRRELKKQYMEDKKGYIKVKKTAKWLTAVIIVALVIGGMWLLTRSNSIDPEKSGETLAIKDNDWLSGSKEAKAVLVEYGDFQCPACAAFHPIVKELKNRFSEDDLTVVYRHFPLTNIHPFAFQAGQVAEAAGRQGKFWEMHDLLYERQNDWVSSANKEEAFELFATQIGIDIDQFRADLDSSDIDNKVREDVKGGQSVGVSGTPTFFLNGEKLNNLNSVDLFASAIQDQIDLNK